jgi:glycine/D-amino acid oxidase-like deaminating enzyme
VTLAPLLARLGAAEIASGRPEPELEPYRPTRFASGVTPAPTA